MILVWVLAPVIVALLALVAVTPRPRGEFDEARRWDRAQAAMRGWHRGD